MTVKKVLFLSATVFLLSFNQNLYAHSGGTDSYGCHTNHSTGVYHCHNPKGYRNTSKARAPASLSSTNNQKKSERTNSKSVKKNLETVAQK